jgi:hypothetical protein
MENYIKLESVSLKKHPLINEKWVQQKIEEDPSILGLGDLSVRQSEKRQETGGRINILLQDDGDTRYAVELQLGKTDETHIVRTIEYWDNERKRNQNYKYVAVIIAEDITNRFFNVISLFNGSIPIIAIQLSAIKVKNEIGLKFTTVLNLITPDDDEEEVGEPTDRAYWENRATKNTVKMTDEMLGYINEFADGFALKCNKPYIGLLQNGIVKNFVKFIPQKSNVRVGIKIEMTDEIEEIISNSNLDIEHKPLQKKVRFSLTQAELENNKEIIVDLFRKAYVDYTGERLNPITTE